MTEMPSYVTPCTCNALRQATRAVTQLYDHCLAPTGLRLTQYSILANLARVGTVSVQEFADHLVMDRTSLTHNLGPLLREELVEVKPGKRDRRVREVALTSKGRARLGEAKPFWEDAQRRFEAPYGETEAAELRQTLGMVTAATNAAIRLTATVERS